MPPIFFTSGCPLSMQPHSFVKIEDLSLPSKSKNNSEFFKIQKVISCSCKHVSPYTSEDKATLQALWKGMSEAFKQSGEGKTQPEIKIQFKQECDKNIFTPVFTITKLTGPVFSTFFLVLSQHRTHFSHMHNPTGQQNRPSRLGKQ